MNTFAFLNGANFVEWLMVVETLRETCFSHSWIHKLLWGRPYMYIYINVIALGSADSQIQHALVYPSMLSLMIRHCTAYVQKMFVLEPKAYCQLLPKVKKVPWRAVRAAQSINLAKCYKPLDTNQFALRAANSKLHLWISRDKQNCLTTERRQSCWLQCEKVV